MTKEAKAKSFSEILDAADRLSLEEQETLIEVLSHRAADRRRDLLGRDIRKTRKEFRDGQVRQASPDDIMSEILS